VSRRRAISSLTAIVLLAVSQIAACGGSSTRSTHPTGFAERPIDAPQRYQDAAQRYAAACASCHGSSGDGGLSGVPLDRTTAADRHTVMNAIRYGVGGMPASRGGMSDEQIIALADYVAGLR
jgi:cytochrome c551